jgi:ABC-2 type transport system permease protein
MSSDTVQSGTTGPGAISHLRGSGVIHDIGYRNYEGSRIGRAGIVRALFWHSFRSAWGMGRGPKAKVVPTFAFVVMCLPAAVNAFVVSRTGIKVIAYDAYLYDYQLVLVLYLAAITPELISRDIRNRTLPLYFSRPLRRSDYPVAKVGALIAALLALTALPQLLLYVGTISSLHGGSEVWAETRAFLPGLEIAVLYSVVFAVVAAVLCCFTGRRAFATGAVAIFFFGSWVVSSALVHLTGYQRHFVRTADGGYMAFNPAASTGSKVSGLLSPVNLLEGLRTWVVGHARAEGPPVPYPGSFGVVYAAVTVGLVALCGFLLLRRYQKASLL